MELVSVFTAAPEFTVLQGRQELGSVDPSVLTRKTDGPRIIVLGARSWRVTHIDWKRRRCYVEAADAAIRMHWSGSSAPQSFALARAQRDVLLGATPEVVLSERATSALAELRAASSDTVCEQGTVLLRERDDVHWWTWAGARANATLVAALPDVADVRQQPHDFRIRLQGLDAARGLSAALSEANVELARPTISTAALQGLKFAEVLPEVLALDTLAARATDAAGAATLVTEPRQWLTASTA
jgi:ATP-dependent Lhr-like helicase